MTLLRATRTAASRPERTSATSRATGSAPSAAPARRTSPPTRTRTAPVAATEPARAGSGPGRSRRRRPALLEVLVFAVGAATLGSEIAAARLMAPFFGDSTIIWANTIAVVLVALSIGYWFGGRMADRRPELGGLCQLVLVAAALLAVVPIVAHPFLTLS